MRKKIGVMAIVEVEEKKNKGDSVRKAIEHDIQEALDKHIEHFEFVGDYNYATLAQNARMVVSRLFRNLTKPIYRQARLELLDKIQNEHANIWLDSWYEYEKFFIKIRQHKSKDRIHVYGDIDFDFLDSFKEILIDDAVENYEKAQIRNGYTL